MNGFNQVFVFHPCIDLILSVPGQLLLAFFYVQDVRYADDAGAIIGDVQDVRPVGYAEALFSDGL